MFLKKAEVKEDPQGYQKIVILIVFIAGLLNSQQYMIFMGLEVLSYGLTLLFYGLLGVMVIIMILNSLYNKKFPLLRLKYCLLLVLGVIVKFIILYIQFPSLFLPGGIYFSEALIFGSNFMIMIILPYFIKNIYFLKSTIWALGISTSLSVIIPFIFFPELIGQRAVEDFSGSFWNYSLISFISIGWILVSLSSIERAKIKKVILISIFILLALGSLAGLSRSMLLSLLCSIFVYLVMTKQVIKNLKTIIFLTISIVSFFYFFQEPIENYMLRLEGGINIEEESRAIIWKDYLEDLPEFLPFGAINGDYKQYSTTQIAPHSVILNWLSQFGVLAFFGFLILLLGFLKITSKLKKKFSSHFSAGLYAWLASYLSVALINETGFEELTIYCTFGIMLVFGSLLNKGEFDKI